MKSLSEHMAGVVLVVVSAVVFSTAGLFSKGVTAGSWEIIFWRSIFAAAFTLIYVLWRGTFGPEFVRMSKSGWAVAAVGASGTAAFIPAFKLTSIANVSLIYAASPLFAALIAWLWVRDALTLRIFLACAATFAGVAIIMSGTSGKTSLSGDLLALWMSLAMALLMVIYRVYPKTPAAGPMAISSLLLVPPALVFGAPLAIAGREIAITGAFGLMFAVASVTLAEGARRLAASEAALLSSLEIALAPVFAWLVFGEVPVFATVAGGLLIVAAVISTQTGSGVKKAGQY